MKRVLSSGYIKLITVTEETEIPLINRMCSIFRHASMDKCIEQLVVNNADQLRKIEFKFEIKAPFLLSQTFQTVQLGYIELFPSIDLEAAYMPPFFYSKDQTGFKSLSSQQCNELNTKFNNYYRNMANFYTKLVESGLCPEQAKLVLPLGLYSTFNWYVNAKDLIQFIKDNKNSSPEVYGYCENFVFFLKETMPHITNWLQKNQPIL